MTGWAVILFSTHLGVVSLPASEWLKWGHRVRLVMALGVKTGLIITVFV